MNDTFSVNTFIDNDNALFVHLTKQSACVKRNFKIIHCPLFIKFEILTKSDSNLAHNPESLAI